MKVETRLSGWHTQFFASGTRSGEQESPVRSLSQSANFGPRPDSDEKCVALAAIPNTRGITLAKVPDFTYNQGDRARLLPDNGVPAAGTIRSSAGLRRYVANLACARLTGG